jgi:NTE family protein
MAKRRPRIGIALGAGSARGWAHIGVLRALTKEGIEPDVVCGTSIGALVGAVYANDTLPQLEEWVLALTWRRVMSYFDISFSSGLLKGGKLFDYLRGGLLEKRIEDLRRPFAAVATDLANGREVWLREGMVAEAVRASIAMPGLFTPYLQGDRLLVDGALVNPVPVSLARALDADFVIAVDLSSRSDGRNLARAEGRKAKTPGMVEVITSGLNIMSTRITRARMAGEPADAVIQPRLGGLGLLEYHRAAEAIAEGRAATQLAIPGIQRALQEWR